MAGLGVAAVAGATAAAAAVKRSDNGAGGTVGSNAASEPAVGDVALSGLPAPEAPEAEPLEHSAAAAATDADQPQGASEAVDEGGSGSAAGGKVLSGRLPRLRPHQLTEIPEDAPVAPPLTLDEVDDDELAACAVHDGENDMTAATHVGPVREGSAGNSTAASSSGSGVSAVTLGAAACGAAAAAAVAGGAVAAARSPSSGPPITHHHQHVGGVCLLDGMEQYNSTGAAEAAVILPGSTASGTADLAAGGEWFDDAASVSSVSSSASRHYLEPVPLDEFALRSLKREASSSSKHTPLGAPGLSRRSAPGLGSRSSSSGDPGVGKREGKGKGWGRAAAAWFAYL